MGVVLLLQGDGSCSHPSTTSMWFTCLVQLLARVGQTEQRCPERDRPSVSAKRPTGMEKTHEAARHGVLLMDSAGPRKLT